MRPTGVACQKILSAEVRVKEEVYTWVSIMCGKWGLYVISFLPDQFQNEFETTVNSRDGSLTRTRKIRPQPTPFLAGMGIKI